MDAETEEDSDDCDSMSGFSTTANRTGGTMVTERNTTTSPGLNYLVDRPLSPVSAVSVTDPELLISQIGPNDVGGAYQVSPAYDVLAKTVITSWEFSNMTRLLTP